MSRYIYTFGLAVIRERTLLLCQPFAFDDLIVPGGVREGNEGPVQNLLREVKEELGEHACLDIDSLWYMGKFSDIAAGKPGIVEVELYAGQVDGELTASSEIKELIWFAASRARAYKLSPVVERKILPFLRGCGAL